MATMFILECFFSDSKKVIFKVLPSMAMVLIIQKFATLY